MVLQQNLPSQTIGRYDILLKVTGQVITKMGPRQVLLTKMGTRLVIM